MSHHLIAHVEIRDSDLERTRKFYFEVFGWDLKEFGNSYMLCNTRQAPQWGFVR